MVFSYINVKLSKLEGSIIIKAHKLFTQGEKLFISIKVVPKKPKKKFPIKKSLLRVSPVFDRLIMTHKVYSSQSGAVVYLKEASGGQIVIVIYAFASKLW